MIFSPVWAQTLVPPLEQTPTAHAPQIFGEKGYTLPTTLPLNMAATDIPLPDGRAYRSMSRAAVLMAGACLPLQDTLKEFLMRNPFSVGLYCAVDNGPTDYSTSVELTQTSREQFAERYRRLKNPKTYLKQLPNLAPAQVGIFLKIQGPMNVYTHSRAGGLHALEQAQRDLGSGLVEAALVCSAMSFEDSLETLRSARQAPPGTILTEGAGAVLYTRAQKKGPSMQVQNHPTPLRYYGIADPVIKIALDLEHECREDLRNGSAG